MWEGRLPISFEAAWDILRSHRLFIVYLPGDVENLFQRHMIGAGDSPMYHAWLEENLGSIVQRYENFFENVDVIRW